MFSCDRIFSFWKRRQIDHLPINFNYFISFVHNNVTNIINPILTWGGLGYVLLWR